MTFGPADLDFWIGVWDLSWPGGGRGTNRLGRILDDRVILEEFEGSDMESTLSGMSLSVYDEADRVWRQTWVDSTGSYLDLVGEAAVDGRLAFARTRLEGGIAVRYRMVWLDVTPDAFRWEWQRSVDGGLSWEVRWAIRYARHPGEAV